MAEVEGEPPSNYTEDEEAAIRVHMREDAPAEVWDELENFKQRVPKLKGYLKAFRVDVVQRMKKLKKLVNVNEIEDAKEDIDIINQSFDRIEKELKSIEQQKKKFVRDYFRKGTHKKKMLNTFVKKRNWTRSRNPDAKANPKEEKPYSEWGEMEKVDGGRR